MKKRGSGGKWKEYWMFHPPFSQRPSAFAIFLVWILPGCFPISFQLLLFHVLAQAHLFSLPREKQTSTGTAWRPSVTAKSCRRVINSLLRLLYVARGPSSCSVQSNVTLLWLGEQGFTAHSLWPISTPLQTAKRAYLNTNHQTQWVPLPPKSMPFCYLCTSEDLTVLLPLRKTLWIARSTPNTSLMQQTKPSSAVSLSKAARASF